MVRARTAGRAARHWTRPESVMSLYSPRDVKGLSHLCKGPVVREQPQPLDGRHQASLRSQSPAGPDRRRRYAAPRLRVHALPEGRQGHQGSLSAAVPRPPPAQPSSGRPPTLAVSDPSIVRFRALVEAGLVALEARRDEVNDLNVFPVADGDTGDNMVLTLRAVLQELDRLSAASEDRTIDDIGRDEIVASVARAALLGARGNSGVILSQLIRGAAEELASRPGELVDPVLISAALARAADQAYGSVREPAEGTILTVVREMSVRVASELAHAGRPARTRGERRASGCRDRRRDRVRARGRAGLGQARARPAAGAARGRRRRRRRILRSRSCSPGSSARCAAPSRRRWSTTRPRASPTPSTPPRPTATARTSRSPASTWSRASFVRALEQLGDSVLVVGDRTTLKVHVHTDDPDAATALFADAARSRTSTSPTCASRSASARSGSAGGRSRPSHAAALSRSSPATACARCSRASASACSTAARR